MASPFSLYGLSLSSISIVSETLGCFLTGCALGRCYLIRVYCSLPNRAVATSYRGTSVMHRYQPPCIHWDILYVHPNVLNHRVCCYVCLSCFFHLGSGQVSRVPESSTLSRQKCSYTPTRVEAGCYTPKIHWPHTKFLSLLSVTSSFAGVIINEPKQLRTCPKLWANTFIFVSPRACVVASSLFSISVEGLIATALMITYVP